MLLNIKSLINTKQINECYYGVFTKTFQILLYVYDREGVEEEEEEEGKEIQINATKSFKSDECVICLNKPPNILFCNCEHMSICGECEEMKPLNICPVCKTRNSIKRVIE